MTRFLPQNISLQRDQVRLILVYKSFAGPNISHIGLGIAALNTAKTLRSRGFDVEIWAAKTAADIRDRIARTQTQAHQTGRHPISHVVISAPWVSTPDLQALLTQYPEINFAVTSHSNIGFLMADPSGIRLLREDLTVQEGTHNFVVAGNSHKFVTDWTKMYGVPVTFLPNLYDVSAIKNVGERTPWHRGQTLRIGIFGATRPLKNMVTATAAAIELSADLKNDVEIHMNTGRTEGPGTVRSAIDQLVAKLPNVKLVEIGWQSWPEFRRHVGHMHLLMSPSYTESFNVVTADGIVQGVSSVVSEAIDWVPEDWQADADNVGDVTRTARRLLFDPHAVSDGQQALRKYVRYGVHAWERYLLGSENVYYELYMRSFYWQVNFSVACA